MEQHNNTQLPAEYNPIGCEHKLSNGFTAWDFYSGGSGSGPELHYDVSILVCRFCGEIKVAGYRWDGKSKHNDRFNETFNIYHPVAIDAIIKQANFFNEEAKWGRIDNQLKQELLLNKTALELVSEKYVALQSKYEAILATADGHSSQTENVWQSGYAAGHEVGYDRAKNEIGTWVNLAENFTEDWEIMHCRYADDKRKLDTDLFELRDDALYKKGGTGMVKLSEVEYLVEPQSEIISKKPVDTSGIKHPIPSLCTNKDNCRYPGCEGITCLPF